MVCCVVHRPRSFAPQRRRERDADRLRAGAKGGGVVESSVSALAVQRSPAPDRGTSACRIGKSPKGASVRGRGRVCDRVAATGSCINARRGRTKGPLSFGAGRA